MELRHLRYFVVAAEEEHFHRAARRLHIVQPALSRQIRVLEQEVGVELFERLSHGVRLSSAGRVFLDGARKILAETDALMLSAQRAERGQQGLLRIGFVKEGSRFRILPQAFNAFRHDFPGVELTLMPAMSDAQLEALREGNLDAGFVFNRPERDEAFSHLKIRTVDRLLVLPRGHPLAKKREIRLAHLTDYPFILQDRAQYPQSYDRMMARFFQGGLTPRIVQVTEDSDTIVHLVAVGMGISFTLVPDPTFLHKDVVVRRVSDYATPLELELVWDPKNKSPALLRFLDTVRALRQSGKFN